MARAVDIVNHLAVLQILGLQVRLYFKLSNVVILGIYIIGFCRIQFVIFLLIKVIIKKGAASVASAKMPETVVSESEDDGCWCPLSHRFQKIVPFVMIFS